MEINKNKTIERKYFFFDIDGTIAVGMPRFVPESTEKTLNLLKEKGHFISIATGRMNVMAKEFCDKFDIKNMVTDGGNGIVLNGIADIRPLDKNMMQNILEVFDERNIPWAISISDERKCYTRDSRFPDSMKKIMKLNTYMKTIVQEDLDYYDIEEIYKGFAYLTKEEELQIPELESVTYTRYSDHYIIIEQDDKSIGIRKILDLLEVDDKDVVVFGDNTNDIKMFKPEWTSVAMGNAVDSLKEIADFVTKDADDDGIEFACRYFGWIE